MAQLKVPSEAGLLSHLMCEACGVALRLYGIESHPDAASAELRTYVCPRCEEVQTKSVSSLSQLNHGSLPLLAGVVFEAEEARLLGSTFDAAWQAVVASDSLPTDARYQASSREMLARCLIDMIRKATQRELT
jgi:hypothetical protein